MIHGNGARIRSMRIWWAALAMLAVSCTAQIGSPPAPLTGPGGGQGGAVSAGQAGSNGGGQTGSNGGQSGATTGQAGGIPSGSRDPGRVTIRRLNRAEYDNTVHDLLGTAQTPGASAFPDDAPQLGFDNNGDLQTLSPVQFALYQQAAESLAAEAMTIGSTERAQLVTCDLTILGSACAQTLITNIGLRAFRRPLTPAEVTSYVALLATAAQAGATTDEQFRTVLEALLVSPNFLFRPEFDASPTSLSPHPLGPYETASRLSYMAYRSMPDQALFAASAAGTLSQPAEVQAQLQRMLADPRAVFAPTFVSGWLGTGVVSTQTFDAALFPKFNPKLAASMGQEVIDFFNEFLQKNEPVSQLLTANFSYIDNNLATLYGIPAVGGNALARTALMTSQRGGLLAMAGVLSVTSYPTRTSVVKRGNWVLSQLLCAPPPAPPANVPPFPTGMVSGTQRQILAQHRASPACAGCHNSMDNIGLAMENYDAIGAYRTQENGVPIDASGMFIGAYAEPTGAVGPSFTGAQQLSAAVAADPRFTSCVAQNALTYSLGRALTLTGTDAPYLAEITTAPQTGSLGVRDILMNVVASDTFRMRRGEP